MKIKLLIAITLLALISCKEYKTKEFDFGGRAVFNQSNLDSLISAIEQGRYTTVAIDAYPLQFGPEIYDANNQLLNDLQSPENAWDISKLLESEILDSLTFYSFCNFKGTVSKKSNLKYLAITSHSCGRTQSKVEIDFSKMVQLEELILNRQILRHTESQKIGQLKNIKKLTFDDCEIDIKDIINLKSSLKYLNLTNSRINNWHMLSEFKQLEFLYIGNIENIILSKNENIAFLGGLKKLRELSVKRNSINSLECIKYLENLEKLYIQKTVIKEIPIELKKKKIDIIKSDY